MDSYTILSAELRNLTQSLNGNISELQKKADKLQKVINKVTRGDYNASDLSAAYSAQSALAGSIVRLDEICGAINSAASRFSEASAELSGRANLTAYYMQHTSTLSYEGLMGTYTTAIASAGSASAGYEVVKGTLSADGYPVGTLGTVSSAVQDAIQREAEEQARRAEEAKLAKAGLTLLVAVGGFAVSLATGGAAAPFVIGAISGAVMAGGNTAIDQYAEHGWDTDKWDCVKIGKDAFVGGVTGATTAWIGGNLTKGVTNYVSGTQWGSTLLNSSDAYARVGVGAVIGSASEVVSGVGSRGTGTFISTMVETNGDLEKSLPNAKESALDVKQIVKDAVLGGVRGGKQQYKEWKAEGVSSGPATGSPSNSDGDACSAEQNSERQYPYSTSDEMSDDAYKLARGYQENPEWNQIIREGNTTPEIDDFRNMIDRNTLPADSHYVRRASLADMGPELQGVSLDELPGKSYQFKGIMSASGSMKMANSVSSGNVIYNISAPEGTRALDLTNLTDFNEVMFNSPNCRIDGVKTVGYNTTQINITIK